MRSSIAGRVPLELDEHSHAGMAAAYCAGAARLPFGVLRGYLGTDLPAVNPRIRSVDCPFTGERLAAVPAINPDVTILHAQRADRAGNVAIHGIVGAQREAALAARVLVVTVEEIVDELPPAMNAIVLPHWVVTAVVHCPGGAYPSYAQGHYARDNAFYQRWDAIARDRERFPRLDGAARARAPATTRVPRQPAEERHERLDARRDDDRSPRRACCGTAACASSASACRARPATSRA